MAKTTPKKITVLIPCYNEEDGVGSVIQGFPYARLAELNFELEVIVIDNNSTDRTAEIARANGATVLHEPKKGKGNAIRLGFASVAKDADYVVMLDGDNTYQPKELLRLIELLDSGFCNVVIGSRLNGRVTEGSMRFTNRLGNWVFSHLVRYFYNVNVTDVLTGYFAWTRESLEQLRPHLTSNGFAIEMEMVTKMARMGEQLYCVPITYDSREGETNLRPFYDGSRILMMFFRNLFWQPMTQPVRRIAFVSDAVMPFNMGGKERRLHEISKRLVSEDCEVHIYTMKWWEGASVLKHDGVYLHAISPMYPLYNDEKRSIKQAIFFGFATFKLLFERFDVLDVDHMPFFPLISARIVTWLRGKKLYATWHEVWGKEYWMEYLQGPMGWYGYLIESLSLMLPDVIISNSAHTTKKLAVAGCKREIMTVPLGIDLEKINTSGVAAEKSDVIFVGRLLNHKNVDLLVQAIAMVKESWPKVMCNVVGDGPERSRLEALINSLGLTKNIRLIERVEESEDLYALMKASKMLVLPSTREGFGLVAVEAQGAGIPVITTSHKNNAAKDLVRNGVTGYVVEPTAEAIGDAITMLLENPVPKISSKEVEQYDWWNVTRRIDAAFT